MRGILSLFTLIAVCPVHARLVENWPYERLFKEADLVVVAKAEDTTDTKDRFSVKGLNVELIGQNTRFVAESVLKGKLSDAKKLIVLHFRLPEEVAIMNGPLLVKFQKEGIALKGMINGTTFKACLERPEYMLFLRQRKDGRYEPVSGEYDPALSVRELRSADGFFSRLAHREKP